MSLIEARTAPPVSQAPNMPARIVPLPSARPRGQPQAILCEFEAAMAKAGRVANLAKGRPVVGIVECVAKLISAERQKALHVLAAADRALAELQR
jgi:hypothetical protein